MVYLKHITSVHFVVGSLVMLFKYTALMRRLHINAPLMCLPAQLHSVRASWKGKLGSGSFENKKICYSFHVNILFFWIVSTHSWKVLRSQCLESEIREPSAVQSSDKTPVATTDWCDDADDWGMDSEEKLGNEQTRTAQPETDNLTASLEVSSRLQDLCINRSADGEDPGPATDTPTFQSFYISVVEEADFVGQNDLEHANRLLKEYEEREGRAVGEIAW